MAQTGRFCAAVVLLAVALAAAPARAEDDFSDFSFSPARALLQSGTSCPTKIPGCLARRCTTRTVDSVKDRYVCLRCKQGFVPVLSSNRKSIIQCICPPGQYMTGGLTAAATCEPCPTGSYCPGGNKKASNPGDDMGTARDCNPPGSTGLTTKQTKATKPTDCVATAGYVLPSGQGGNATQCTGSTYAPALNKLSACLKCQSGLGTPPTYTGPRTNKEQVCQVPPGRFWELNVVRDCPKGLYRGNYTFVTAKDAISCLPCPIGWTTPGISTTAIGFCNALLPGFMVSDQGFTPGQDTTGQTVTPQTPDDSPPATTLCPKGFYFDGNSTGVFACLACPTGSTTRQNGSISLDECVVPPGYYLNTVTNSQAKCPTGYYRTGWVSFKFAQDTNGTTACTKCGEGIPSRPTEADESDDLPTTSSDPFLGLVAATSASCYIQAGWGITFDPNDFKKFRAIAPCPANTYGVANTTFGLINAPCKACSKNLYAPAESTDYTACKNPAGFGYNSEGANQCSDGFYSPAQQMQPCIQCPPCRTTPPFVPGDGSLQNSSDNCLIIPGCGVYRPNDTDPWNPPNPGPGDGGSKCPLGKFTTAADEGNTTTLNPTCKDCPAGQWTSAVGSITCDVCAAGFGADPSTGNVTADCANQCPYGTYGDSTSTACVKCPDTVFNHEYGNAVTSYGVTFYKGLSGPESCVPRFSQQANPSGHIMSLPDAMFTNITTTGSQEDCIKTCDPSKCCINQFESISADRELEGTCKRAILDAVSSGSTGARLFVKLPPSQLIAAASEVEAKTQASGIYAICDLSGYATEAANGEIGTSPFATDVEQPKNFTRWGDDNCSDMATCKATCNALATCYGFINVPGKGYALRGGEMQLGFRTFFASPDGSLLPNLPDDVENLAW